MPAEKLALLLGVSKLGLPSGINDFADYVERQARTMAQSGWTSDATHLRKWASELRGKSVQSGQGFDNLPRSQNTDK